MSFKIGKPAAGGSGFDKVKHTDHLLAFIEPKAEERTTRYGDTVAATVSYVACLDCQTVDHDVDLYGQSLVPALTDSGEEIVVGRLGLGEAKAGQNAPWLLWDPTDDEVAQAEQFLEQNAVRTPSGRIIVEIAAL
jgi:hypothetical protein